MAIVMYGISNCNTVKKARTWLEEHGVEYTFHDYKKAGIDRASLERWSREVGWEKLLNRAGPTFRNLPDADKEGLNAQKAVKVMMAHTSAIKRPVLDVGDRRLVGFSPEAYEEAGLASGKRRARA